MRKKKVTFIITVEQCRLVIPSLGMMSVWKTYFHSVLDKYEYENHILVLEFILGLWCFYSTL